MPKDAIQIRGARQNNLKNISLEIPLNAITVITGVSGSGKSSFAHDTLYAEGQRRYVETFSPYARQFMDRMDRPDVDAVEGIPPAIAITNKSSVRTSRSTVGTMTEITDYVKLLFTRMGELHCRRCGRPVIPEGPEDVWKALKQFPEGTEAVITFPFSLRSTDHEKVRRELRTIGLDRFFSHGRIRSIDEWRAGNGMLHIVTDRLLLRLSERKRIMDSLEQAFRFGGGHINVWIKGGPDLSFSSQLECARCKIAYKRPTPNLFSFNSPIGACEMCRGFGRVIDVDFDLVIPDGSRSLEQGAIKPWGTKKDHRAEYEDLVVFCHEQGIPTKVPFDELKEDHKHAILEGN
jgi:excinuclease ABC subunit A